MPLSISTKWGHLILVTKVVNTLGEVRKQIEELASPYVIIAENIYFEENKNGETIIRIFTHTKLKGSFISTIQDVPSLVIDEINLATQNKQGELINVD